MRRKLHFWVLVYNKLVKYIYFLIGIIKDK